MRMVLERVLPATVIEKKPLYAFLLGIGYSIIGILIARLLFPADPALVAVAFISIFLLPELRKIFALEERQERKEKRFSWKHLWKDDRDVITTYMALFLGIFITYAVLTIWLPAFSVNTLFQQQLAYRGAVGYAAIDSALFTSIFSNNLLVLAAIFFIGLVAGDGASFLVTWNASVWGTIFGAVAREGAGFMGLGPVALLLVVLVIVTPHMILEGLSYVMAAISGSVISKDIESEKLESKAFKEVFTYNVFLLIAAIAVLLIGVLVESWVLENVTLYADIIAAGYR